MDTTPEKSETPSGKYAAWILGAAALAYVAFLAWYQNPAPTPEKSQTDICEGLSDRQCVNAQAIHRERMRHAEALQDANIID